MIDGGTLADQFRAADPETVAAFVADLYAARGYDVERRGELLFRLEPGERTLAIRPTDAAAVPGEADAVVTVAAGTAPDPDLDVVDADVLAEHLAYAVDRSVARDLLGTHFGIAVKPDDPQGRDDPPDDGSVADGHLAERSAGPSSHPTADGTRDGRGDTPIDPRRWRRRRLTVAVALLATLLLVGGLGGGLLATPSDVGATGDTATTATPTPSPAATATPPADRNGDAIATGDSSRRTPQQSLENATEQLTAYPPGVDERGLADIDTLIAAHRSVLSNTSFTVTVQYREFEDGRVTGTFVETVRVERPSRYAVSVDSAGTLETTPRAVVGADAFSNENRTWVRLRSTEPYVRSRLSRSRMLGQLARYLRWSLSVENSTLREHSEGGTYRITTDGDPYQGITDASGTAYVTDEGLVTYGRWTYTNVRPETRVEFSIHTTDVGSTTVSRPRWIDTETGNESDGS